MNTDKKILLYAAKWCSKCKEISRFLDSSGTPYKEIDIEALEDVGEEDAGRSIHISKVPTVQVGEDLLVAPDVADLAYKIGIPLPKTDVFDVAIIGGGPAGLTAAIYGARENLKILLLEKAFPGGQAATTNRIENYPGFPDPVGGPELMERIHRQAANMGADIRLSQEVKAVMQHGDVFRIKMNDGEHIAKTIIAAPGSVYQRLNVPGEKELLGKGVSFCATCDAPFYKGKRVIVVGGGNSALQETVHLAEFASKITIVQLQDHLTGSKILIDRVNSLPSTEVLLSHRVTRVVGSQGVEGVELENPLTKKSKRLNCDGVFVFIGMHPSTDFLQNNVDLDKNNFILTDPGTLETSVPGIFAAGDARAGSSKQITSAVGEGTVALFNAMRLLAERNG